MKYKLHITIPAYTEELDTFPIPENENYDYWVPLVRRFIKLSDAVEIHCWNDEEAIITETSLLFRDSFEIVNKGNITVFKGRLTDEISNHLLYEKLNTIGRLKWFSVFLISNNTSVFHSEHWGTEFFAPNLSENDIVFIKSMMPIDTNFNQYK